MINLKDIKEQILTEVAEKVAKRYNEPIEEVKVSFSSDGSIKATMTLDLSFLKCNVKVEEVDNEDQM